jgi:hypothetical protein
MSRIFRTWAWAERRPALAQAAMAPLIRWSFSGSMFRYLLVDHAVPEPSDWFIPFRDSDRSTTRDYDYGRAAAWPSLCRVQDRMRLSVWALAKRRPECPPLSHSSRRQRGFHYLRRYQPVTPERKQRNGRRNTANQRAFDPTEF